MNKCSDYLIKLGLSPWNKAYTGSRGQQKSSQQPINFPSGMTLPHNLGRSGVDPIEMFARCLKAEHSHRVDDRWKNKKDSGCYKYQYDPGATTILHFLYRLRIKSNYHEIDAFVTDAPQYQILQFSTSLHQIVSWTLTLFEIILIARFGIHSLNNQMESYLVKNPMATDLKTRISEYKSRYSIK